MRWLIVALMLCCAPAFALSEAEMEALRPQLSPAACMFPKKAFEQRAKGVAKLSYRPKPDGTLGDVRLEATSGNDDIDQWAVACFARFTFDPNGPVGAYLGQRLTIHIGFDPDSRQWTMNNVHNCEGFYPPEVAALHVEGMTTVFFLITVDGSVERPRVVISSGNGSLDAAALQCVLTWRYKPPVKDGVPSAIPWKVEIKWVVPESLAPGSAN